MTVTYSELLLKCTDLCRTVANGQEKIRYVMSGIIEWTNKLRMKESFKTVFLNTSTTTIHNEDSINVSKIKEPLPAVTKQASIVKASHRLISAREFYHSNSKQKSGNTNISDLDT